MEKIENARNVFKVFSELIPATNPLSSVEQPVRRVEAQILTSTARPAVRLHFGKKFKYAGNQTFILNDNARAEQHFFVDAVGHGCIERFYWVQFEEYLPDNTRTYRYDVNQTIILGGLGFIADAYARNIKKSPGNPGSDGARARAFLDGEGYHMAGPDTISQRLVHLTDETKRSELMIIYTEDLSAVELAASGVTVGSHATAPWDEMSKGLLERALRDVEITRFLQG
jgi:hypothetical protein